MRIGDSVGLVVNRIVGADVCRGVDVGVNMSKVESNLWIHF